MNPLPCPCCGSDDLYVGPLLAAAGGVYCRSCGLKLLRVLPDNDPDIQDAKNCKTFNEWEIEIYEVLCNRAVKAWNKRSGINGN
jgi:hypothetical protein